MPKNDRDQLMDITYELHDQLDHLKALTNQSLQIELLITQLSEKIGDNNVLIAKDQSSDGAPISGKPARKIANQETQSLLEESQQAHETHLSKLKEGTPFWQMENHNKSNFPFDASCEQKVGFTKNC